MAINDKEINLFGINRSGIHAITYWIIGHFEDPVKLRRVSNYNTNNKWTYYFNMDDKQILQEEKGQPIKKACTFLTHEDQPIKEYNKLYKDMKKRDAKFKDEMKIGSSKKNYTILLMRDPFNHFASIMKKHIKKGKTGKDAPPQAKIVKLWVQFAREALGETSYLPKDTVFINYNKWFLEEDYRKSISQLLDLEFTDRWLNKVTKHGTGSSFDKVKYDGNAQEMDVLDRWKEFENDKQYRRIFTSKICRLSEKIFGPNPF